MKKLFIVAAVALLTCGSAGAQSILGRLADRAKNAAENAVGKKVENAVYNAVDKALSKDESASPDKPGRTGASAREVPSRGVEPAAARTAPQAPVASAAKAPVRVSNPVPGAVSFKFTDGDGSEGRYHVYARAEGRSRMDTFDEGMMLNEDDVAVPYSYHDVMLSPGGGADPMKYEEGSWTESYYAAQELSIIWSALVKDRSDFYVRNDGFREAGTAVVCGRTCRKYVGTIKTMGGYDKFTMNGRSAEIYTWNGCTMRLVMDGKVIYEVVGYTESVPESAFTQSLDVNWF